MSNVDDGYRSSDDEDYVPEAGVEDLEDEPSGDEVDEVTADGDIVNGKRRKSGKGKGSKKQKLSDPVPSSTTNAEVDDMFAELMGEEDPLLRRYSNKDEPSTSNGNQSVFSSSRRAAAGADRTEPCVSSSKVEPLVVEDNKKITIVEEFDFAGDVVKVERQVTAEELKAKEAKDAKAKAAEDNKPKKRLGLEGVLNLLQKKPKMSLLSKSDLDWKSFKEEEQISEELKTFNRGKNGYLDKMNFLSRTDNREFEKEKAMRNAARKQN